MKAIYVALLATSMMSTTSTVQANALTRAYVYSVESASGGSELVSGRSTTAVDHGGAWMRIRTDEIGYGRMPQARLLTNSLREIATEPLCDRGTGPISCRRGDTIIGYRRTWDASPHQGGNFEYVVFPAGAGKEARASFQVR